MVGFGPGYETGVLAEDCSAVGIGVGIGIGTGIEIDDTHGTVTSHGTATGNALETASAPMTGTANEIVTVTVLGNGMGYGALRDWA